LHYHLRAMVYPGGLLKSTVQAGLLLARNTPERWGQGPAGFGRRLASSHAARAIRQGLAFGVDSALGEDPHFVRGPHPGFESRFWHAAKQTLVCQNDRLSPTFAIWRVSSALGSALISNSWRPSCHGVGGSQI